ncbi:MAG: Hsp20/alpha crystallin family protein [Verrucomicrobiota bacterium]|jgi:HSP20 family protein
MNALTCWNQSNELEDLQHGPRNLFGRSRIHWTEEQVRVAQWVPLVDLSEDAKGYLLKVELPEVKKEDMRITMDDGTLTITGDRKFDQNSRKDHRVERACGSFVHSFSLPEDARPGKVTAVFKDGVLAVHLAKNEKTRPQQVEVEAAAYDQIPNHHYHSSGWGINE